MATLQPRPPYNEDELARLYPQDLELQQVQIVLRHGERTPTGPRFKNTGLSAYWPYCQSTTAFKNVIKSADNNWDTLTWKRRLEAIGKDGFAESPSGSKGEVDGICHHGELTDRGRETTLALGQRIRTLYVDQLGFLPATLSDSTVALRSTHIQRALESVQQAFTGLYSPAQRTPGLPNPVIVQRLKHDETLYPNEDDCKRFSELFHYFADRAAKNWNDSTEVEYLNKKLGKWMPPIDGKPQAVKVDSHPRLSGIMDTTNATLAHGPTTKLPSEFYDEKVRETIDRIVVEEWFAGYQESNEFRMLGIGGLIGDLTQRMVEQTGDPAQRPAFKISMAGCHDTTMASALASLGAFDVTRDKWPNFTSSIAFELFKKKGDSSANSPSGAIGTTKDKTWWNSFFSSSKSSFNSRTPLLELPESEQSKLDGYYVRLRYNDKPVSIPACRPAGKHFGDDESFCTLRAFKEAADSFTPKNWKAQCGMNLGEPAGSVIEPPPGL